jgi:hypothetical protein
MPFQPLCDHHLARRFDGCRADQPALGLLVRIVHPLDVVAQVAQHRVVLRAQSDILDYYDDAANPQVNIFTGNVYLQTTMGHVGTASNYVEIEILKGDLDGLVKLNTFINSVLDLNVGNYKSLDGNVTLIIDGVATIGLITALGNGVADPANTLTDGLVKITAASNIVDRGTAPSIVATGALLNAQLGIGSAANPLDTQISRLEASIPGGGIWLDNAGDLQIGNISPLVGITALNTVGVSVLGTLTVNEAIDSVHGPDLLDASKDIVVNAGITSGGGIVTLHASRDIIFTAVGFIDTEVGVPTITLTADFDQTGGGGTKGTDTIVNEGTPVTRDTPKRTDGRSWLTDGYRPRTLFTIDGGASFLKVNAVVDDVDPGTGNLLSSKLILTLDGHVSSLSNAAHAFQRMAYAVSFDATNWWQEVKVHWTRHGHRRHQC